MRLSCAQGGGEGTELTRGDVGDSGNGGGGSGPDGSAHGDDATVGLDRWAWGGLGESTARSSAMVNTSGLRADGHRPTGQLGHHENFHPKHGRLRRRQRGQSNGCKRGVVAGLNDKDSRAKDSSSVSGALESPFGASDNGNRCSRIIVAEEFQGDQPIVDGASHGRNIGASVNKIRTQRIHANTARPLFRDEGSSENLPFPEPASRGQHPEEVDDAKHTKPKPLDGFQTLKHFENGPQDEEGFRQDFNDPLAPPGSAATVSLGSSSFHQQGDHSGTAVVVSGQSIVLSMDERGGSAAPPFRPPAVRSHSPSLLPGLVRGGIVSAMIPESGAVSDRRRRAVNEIAKGRPRRWSSPTSRQRASIRESLWQGFTHSQYYSHGDELRLRTHQVEGRLCPGLAIRLGGRVALSGLNATAGGTRAAQGAAVRSDTSDQTKDYGIKVQDASRPSAGVFWSSVRTPEGAQRNLPEAPRRRLDGGDLANTTESDVTDESPARSTTSTKQMQQDSRSVTTSDMGDGSLDFSEGFLPGSTTMTPKPGLISHFRVVPRPASRRGTRKKGTHGRNSKPGFSLFSRPRDTAASVEDRGDGLKTGRR